MLLISQWPRKTWRRSILVVLILCLAIFHKTVLRGIGNYLVVEDAPRHVDAIYVLSGNPGDRGTEAAALWKAGWAPEVVCLGGEKTHALELYGFNDLTAIMSQRVVLDHGVDSSHVRLLQKGTSTFEEYEAIVEDCKSRGYDDIMIVSSRFHTRRIHAFFRYRLQFEGINLCLRGAYESEFQEDAWWKVESGLLFVNNEYIKMAYYFLRY